MEVTGSQKEVKRKSKGSQKKVKRKSTQRKLQVQRSRTGSQKGSHFNFTCQRACSAAVKTPGLSTFLLPPLSSSLSPCFLCSNPLLRHRPCCYAARNECCRNPS